MAPKPAPSWTEKLLVFLRKQATLLVVVFLCALTVIGAVLLLQDALVYYPTTYSIEQLAHAANQRSVALWPTSGNEYRGLVTPDSTGLRGTVVVFHGNAGSALNRLHYVRALEPLGFRVILAEYPGYGAREGRPGERALVADARTTLRLAERDFGGPLYVWGESLGCGVASAVAADDGLPVEGLVLITPFTSLPDVAQSIYWFLPVKALVREKYDSIANLAGFKKPVAILMAEDDELIPAGHAQRIYDSLTTEKRIWTFKGAGHNTWPVSPGEKWWQEVADFVRGLPALPSQAIISSPPSNAPG
jgi:pimeloyl-ACP methyl ester carboxylesterase